MSACGCGFSRFDATHLLPAEAASVVSEAAQIAKIELLRKSSPGRGSPPLQAGPLISDFLSVRGQV